MKASIHPLRGSVALPLLAMLGACGGDDSSGPPPQSLQEPAAVRWHLAMVMSQVPVARLQTDDYWLLDPLEPLGESCEGGGTVTSTTAIRSSPYAFLAFFVRRDRYQDCVLHYGPTTNPTEATLTVEGIEESAGITLPGGAVVTYQQSGSTDGATPLHRRFRAVASGGNREEDHYIVGRSDTYSLVSGATREYQGSLIRTHELSIRFPGVADFAGTYRLGSLASPFTVDSSNDVTELAGEYEIDTAHCQSGAMQLATTEEIVYDPDTDRFVAGTLEFTGSEGTARASFRADGRVTLTSADGSQRTESFEPPLLPWGSDCFGTDD